MRKRILYTLLLLLSMSLTGCRDRGNYYRITGYAQGGTYSVTYSEVDPTGNVIPISPEVVKGIIDSTLQSIDKSLSGYNPNSILTKVNKNQSDTLDHLFIEMFETSKGIYAETSGKFDPSAAPLFDIWGFGFQDREAISQHKIDSIKKFVGMDLAHIEGCRLIKKDPRFKLNFNAIAQGYSCDVVARELDKRGICNYLVEVGMEIYCRGLNPSGNQWNIGVDTPEDGNMEAGKNISEIISVTDAGIVTSGNYRKFFIENGQKYSHTIDPSLGYPVKHNLLSATIIASNATLADAYATYCMVVGLEEAKNFLNSRSDLEGYLIFGTEDGGMSVYYTENLKSQLIKK